MMRFLRPLLAISLLAALPASALSATASSRGLQDPPRRVQPGKQGGKRHITSHNAKRVWVPGRWVQRKVLENRPGHWERTYVPPVTRTRLDRTGKQISEIVEPGRYENRWIEARTIIVKRKEWIPGHWKRS